MCVVCYKFSHKITFYREVWLVIGKMSKFYSKFDRTTGLSQFENQELGSSVIKGSNKNY